MNESALSRRGLPELLAAKEAAERAGDLDAILAVFVDDPVFEFYPIRRRLVGVKRVRDLYKHMLADFMPRVVEVDVVTSFMNEVELIKEQLLTVRLDDASTSTFRLVVVTGMADEHLWGQRFYGDESFFRLLLGDLLDDSASREP